MLICLSFRSVNICISIFDAFFLLWCGLLNMIYVMVDSKFDHAPCKEYYFNFQAALGGISNDSIHIANYFQKSMLHTLLGNSGYIL